MNIVKHEYDGFLISQRVDGFVNLTQMALANDKNIADYFKTQGTFEYISALSAEIGIDSNMAEYRDSVVSRLSATDYAKLFPSVVVSKRGSPSAGGGTWAHPEIAIDFAQWVSTPFRIWANRTLRLATTSTRREELLQLVSDRYNSRLALKENERVKLADEVKNFLVLIGRYTDRKYSSYYFSQVHDALNLSITGETSRRMKERLYQEMGVEANESTLIRDYFPIEVIEYYRAVCRVTINFIVRQQMSPLEAIFEAARMTLPYDYEPQPVDFEVNINRLMAMKEQFQLEGY